MNGSLLTYLDILIGFALVMLLASSIVTVLSQWLLNVRNFRAVVLRKALQRLLIQVDDNLKDHAEAIAKQVLLHPLVAGRSWSGKEKEGAAIQREQLVRVLLELATTKMPPAVPPAAPSAIQKAVEALRKAFDLDETDGDTPKAQLEAIQAQIMQLEVEFPGIAAHVLRARAILENTSARFVSGVMSWFDETSERMTQEFAQRARSLTVVLSTLVAFALPLDAIDLLRRLSLDEALRSRLVEAAQKIEQQGEAAPETKPQTDEKAPKPEATPNPVLPQGEAVPMEAPPPSEATPKVDGSQKTESQTSPHLTEVKRLRGELERLAIIPKGGVCTFLQEEKSCIELLDDTAKELRVQQKESQRKEKTQRPGATAKLPDTIQPQNQPQNECRKLLEDTTQGTDCKKRLDALQQQEECKKLLDDIRYKTNWAKLWGMLPGLLLSICLMSLGAPFWFEALKNLLKLRPTLAQTEEKERQEREKARTAKGGIALAKRQSEAGDPNADAIAARPGTEG